MKVLEQTTIFSSSPVGKQNPEFLLLIAISTNARWMGTGGTDGDSSNNSPSLGKRQLLWDSAGPSPPDTSSQEQP